MLKNYTTSITIEKTISEIESILAKHGAKNIYKTYNDNGIPVGLAFECIVNDTPIAFKLPMEESQILLCFKNGVRKGGLHRRYDNNIDQARRTGWRIIKDWIDSQMALIEIHLVKFEEVFLPYMYDRKSNQTLFKKFEERNFNLQLDYKPNEVEE